MLKPINAPHELATALMDDFFNLYQYVALGLGLDIEDITALTIADAEGIAFAQRKFLELVDEFEKNLPGIEIRWCRTVENEEDDEE